MKKFTTRWNLQGAGMLGSAGQASVIGLHLASGIFVGCLAGYWLDEWLGTSPWLKIVFFFLGLAAGFINVYRDARHLLAEDAALNRDGMSAKDKVPARQNMPAGKAARTKISGSTENGGGSGNNGYGPDTKS